MLTVEEPKPRVYEVTLSGVVDAADIAVMRGDLTPALEAAGRMALVLRLEDLEDITGDAMVADARFEMSLLPKWTKVARIAVVTDKQAFEALFRWADPILPTIEFHTFAPGEAAAARDWAAGFADGEASEGPGLRVVEDGTDGLMLFEIDGKVDKGAADDLFAALDRAAATHGKVNLMVRIRGFEGFDPALLFDRGTMASKFGAIGKVGRYAVVGAPAWMDAMVQAMGPLVPIEMRCFDAAEDAAAQDWARAG